MQSSDKYKCIFFDMIYCSLARSPILFYIYFSFTKCLADVTNLDFLESDIMCVVGKISIMMKGFKMEQTLKY